MVPVLNATKTDVACVGVGGSDRSVLCNLTDC